MGLAVLIADGFFRVVTVLLRAPRLAVDALHGGGSGGGDGGDGGGDDAGGLVALILAVIIFVLVVLLVATILNAIAPLFARLTQVAVSRQREYLADATAVEVGRNPAALEGALLKAATTAHPLAAANRATASLYFVNPIRATEKRASAIFGTHPRTSDRVNRLRQLQGLEPLEGDQGITEDVV